MGKIRKFIGCTLMLSICIQLCGCSQSRQVENQAYILVMGMDMSDDGGLEITTLSPKIAGSSEEAATAGGQGSQGNYLQISVTADDYENALEKLNWAVPRSLNLSQLKMIVLSQELAKKQDCRSLLQEIAVTERLFTAAHVVVCEGEAKDFLEAMQPVIGNRLSTDIDATLDHYIRYGMIPNSTLAEMFFLTESVYSDPMATFALLNLEEDQKTNETKAASALAGTPQKVSASYESDIKTRYLGSVLFSDGEFRGILNGDQTILANLLNNSLDTFRYTCNHECLEFSPVGRTKVKVDTKSDPVKIAVEIELAVSNQEKPLDEVTLNQTFQRDIGALIETIQKLGVEPFGFAEAAAKHFPTLSAWKEYNWKQRFQAAKVELKLGFQHLNA